MNWIDAEWPAPANVHAVTTLRTGGVSDGSFASLNPAAHVDDNSDNVAENRRRIQQMLRLPAQPIWLRQVHGNVAVDADECDGLAQADASYSAQAGTVCAVLTADCLPLLFTNVEGTKIAAVHGGWRGLLGGVIEQTLTVFSSRDLWVWLGPAIGPDCFEVGDEVRQAFMDKSTDFAAAFRQCAERKWLADIYRLARIILAQQGIEQSYGGGFCTVIEEDRFYSYRRDGETGRMATLIWRD